MADLSLIANSARFFLIQDSDLSTYICTSYIYIYVYIYIALAQAPTSWWGCFKLSTWGSVLSFLVLRHAAEA